jgi:RHS repeat-associated protein
VTPFTDWRGEYAYGRYPGGTDCISIGPVCPKFPGYEVTASGIAPTAGDSPTHSVWAGSLLRGRRDASGLTYLRNRYYDANTGRFTQLDPIGLGGGLNLYGFAAGDPVNFSDPFGLCPSCRNELSSRYTEEEQKWARAMGNDEDAAWAAGIAVVAAAGGFGALALTANSAAIGTAAASAGTAGAGLTTGIVTALQRAGPDLAARRDAVLELTKNLDVVRMKELANGAIKIAGGTGSRLREIYLNTDGSSVIRAYDAAKDMWRTVATIPAPK